MVERELLTVKQDMRKAPKLENLKLFLTLCLFTRFHVPPLLSAERQMRKIFENLGKMYKQK